jgi:hypothetical protein
VIVCALAAPGVATAQTATQDITAEDRVITDLKDTLEEIALDRGNINPRMLGRWIERYADTRCSGYYLERQGLKQRAVVWRIRRYEF